MKNYLLEVKLNDTDIERRISVPRGFGFDCLHDVLQLVLGFEDEHLHEFDADGIRIVASYESEDNDDDFFDEESLHEFDAQFDILILNSEKIIYRYDYGDGWEAEIKFLGEVEGESYPQLLSYKGKMAKEDCGGPDGLKGYRKVVKVNEINMILREMFDD